MTPEYFYKVVLIMLGRESVVAAFSVADFLANDGKTILVNSAVQWGGYVGAKAIGNVVTSASFFPIITNSKIAADYLQATQNMPGHPERVATVALVFSLGGLITKTGDLPTNMGWVTFLLGFVDYMASVGNPGGHPFGYIRGAKRLNLTFKQHMKIQVLLFLVMLFSISSFIVLICLTKSLIKGNLIKRSRAFVKRSIKKLKKFYPVKKKMVKFIEI